MYSLLHDMHAKKSHALYSGWANYAGTLLYSTLNKEEPRCKMFFPSLIMSMHSILFKTYYFAFCFGLVTNPIKSFSVRSQGSSMHTKTTAEIIAV